MRHPFTLMYAIVLALILCGGGCRGQCSVSVKLSDLVARAETWLRLAVLWVPLSGLHVCDTRVSGGYRRLGFAGDRCRVQVQAQRASERIYCPSSVDCSASRTACRPLRVFVPSNATHDCIDSTRMRAFRFQVYKVGLHITYYGRNRHLIAGVAPRSGVGNPVNVGTGDYQRDSNEPLCGHA